MDRCSDCVKDATVVNGIVRVTEEEQNIIGFMLETHYYVRTRNDGTSTSGWGPFIAVDPGDSENPLRAVGAGIKVGWQSSERSSKSFNAGLGWAVDNKVTVLGDGIAANQPLPAGETQIRYKKISRGGVMAILSYSF